MELQKLKVERLPNDESGRNLAFIDSRVLSNTNIADGSVVELSTKRNRKLLARVARRPQDEGRDCVRLDHYQLQLLKPDLNEKVKISPVQVEEAQRLVLEPMAPLGENLAMLERELGRRFTEERQLACSGMLISVKLPEFPRSVPFRVISVDPLQAVIGEGTRVVLRTSRLMPGMAANLVTFDDVGGLQAQIEQIRELIEAPLLYPHVFENLALEMPHGILLHGPPGVGKTYLARAIANEIKAHFLYINGPEIVSAVHGGTEANLRRIFEEAMEHSPSVVMIDELDAIAPKRGESGSQTDVRMGTQLLSLLDGLICIQDVIVLGTTNRVNALDPALRRPGRLDREIFLSAPDVEGRLSILNIHTRRVPLDEDAIEFLPEVARMTHGYVGADLMELVRCAGMNAVRRKAGPGFAGLFESEGNIDQLVLQKEDFIAALQQTSPSTLRETLLTLPDVTWEDIGGLDDAVEQLRGLVEMPMRHPEAFEKLRLRPSSGVLIYGPPGTGKTMLAKALAHESGANFIAINGPEVFSKWLGESEEAIRHLFQTARRVAPTVILFDQVDAIASKRRGEAANTTAERVVNQLLAEMDGIQAASRIIVVGVTNRRDLIDPAFLRPGRFGLEIYVDRPKLEGRLRILHILLSDLPVNAPDDLEAAIERIAEKTDGFSGADLSAVCETAKLLALRNTDNPAEICLKSSHLLTALEHLLKKRSEDEHLPG